MIELENIQKSYLAGTVSTNVLKGVSFKISEGEYVSIMGSSGTGKSTLMNILGCLDKPTSGHYRLDDIDMIELDDDNLSKLRNQKIGFIFQQFHLLDRTTALKNVLLPLIYTDSYPEEAEELAEKVLVSVGLEDRIDYTPSELSGGQQQRVAIARALINSPHIILADEPTGNLDSKNGAEVMAIFKRLHREGKTIVMVTHDLRLAEYADRVIVMKDGLVAEDRKVLQPRDAEADLKEIPTQQEATVQVQTT
jgi:putative ABC transport system ATP-binding protein